MREVIENAVAARERVPAKLPTARINGINVPMLRIDVEQAQIDAHRTRQPHNKARETFVRNVLSAMRGHYVEQLDYTPEQAELTDVTLQLRLNDDVRHTLNLAWLPMTGLWLIDQLFSKPKQLRRFAPWLRDDDVTSLMRPQGSALTRCDIALLDEALELLGPDPKAMARQAALEAKRSQDEQFAKDSLAQSGVSNGIVSSRMLLDEMNAADAEAVAQRAGSDREWTYGHIVVDEAQELTAMDWRMLMRRCPSRSFTIVGDVAQTAALGGTRRWRDTMDPLFGAGRWDLDELTINYRNPQEVSNIASTFAHRQGLYISTVNAVRALPNSVVRISVTDPGLLNETVAHHTLDLVSSFVGDDGTGRIAIIAPNDRLAVLRATVYELMRRHLALDRFAKLAAQHSWDEQVTICDTEMVKGLEYDAVIVVQPAEIEAQAPSRLVAASDLYVAMTRPTQRLLIVRTRDDEDQLPL
jgi:hypothetical protein